MMAIIMLIKIMFTTTTFKCYESFHNHQAILLEKAKKIQAAISLAALKLPKLNFPMDIAMVFWMVADMS